MFMIFLYLDHAHLEILCSLNFYASTQFSNLYCYMYDRNEIMSQPSVWLKRSQCAVCQYVKEDFPSCVLIHYPFYASRYIYVFGNRYDGNEPDDPITIGTYELVPLHL